MCSAGLAMRSGWSVTDRTPFVSRPPVLRARPTRAVPQHAPGRIQRGWDVVVVVLAVPVVVGVWPRDRLLHDFGGWGLAHGLRLRCVAHGPTISLSLRASL